MTRLFNDPARFTDDMITGFAAAHPGHVRAVPGGVVRARPARAGKVAVLTGGGSGHYPAFCGVVGPGFADGSVIGDVFTSPSAARARSVAEAAEAGGGVLFLFGNYAGDVMNFGLAARQLEGDGIPARCLAVTDDIASAPADQTARRRGIAGGFVVFKTASAAAEEGAPLDEVVRVAEHTNARTRTLGVAFDGCTLPGAEAPLFTVPQGRLGLGLGIHGEPGVSEDTLGTAEDLARALVTGLLADRPADAGDDGRVAVVLNGLGATKYEELYVLWGAVARQLDEAGLTPVRPEVGELVTSLDMAGCSLTLSWLDEELERLWLAPADTPAFRRTPPPEPPVDDAAARPAASRRPERAAARASGAAAEVAELAVHALRAARDVLHRDAEELGRLDAVAGDGDHGRGMCKGVDAALAAAEKAHTDRLAPAAVLAAAGDAWAAEAGGTSGALWGVGLRAVGAALPADRAPGREELASAAADALTAVTSLGGAEVGDKTLVDALAPFATAFATGLRSGAPVSEAYASAVSEARTAAENTAGLRPRLGRARPLADRSVGTPDPGATSLTAVLTAVATLRATTGSESV
ncbi:dihydroxyacetone kinase family protein [Streptomyces sp. 5-10]|uniref:dihydroxyacetone kinase family protein n=1 Tax=Streptomyces sp. 5-10 TaxID=878925 RepID=UPI00168AA700|nr:dihydroxyacetone kinase family protein [Streptomyces sp. 5-10]MBD3005004.1 dihydroxyacetone kinase family protein [Streptomyces sp. 5-10]